MAVQGLPLHMLRRKALNLLRARLHADSCHILQIEDDGSCLLLLDSEIYRAKTFTSLPTLALQASHAALSMEMPGPLRFGDILKHPGLAAIDREGQLVKDGVCVRIEMPGHPAGVLMACWGAAHEPGESELELLSQVASLLGKAMQDARNSEKLRQDQERLRPVFESDLIGVVSWLDDGTVTAANDYYLRLAGETRERLNAGEVNWRNFTPPEYAAADAKAIDEINKSGLASTYEKEFQHADGSRVRLLIRCSRLSPGREADIVALALDITELSTTQSKLRHHLELERALAEVGLRFATLELGEVDEAIREALERIALTAGANAALLLIFDPLITKVERAMLWTDGLSDANANEAVNLPIAEMTWMLQQLREFKPVILSNSILPPQAVVERSVLEGSNVRAAICVPVHSANGLLGMIMVLSVVDTLPDPPENISMLKQVGELMAVALERQEAEERRRLLEAQLNQAQKLEAIGSLAGGIAHDFNNILQSIHGFGELVLEKLEPGSTAAADQAELLNSANRAGQLVRQILLLSKPASGELRLVKLDLLVREAAKLLRSVLPANISIKVDIKGAGCTVLADPVQLHQVIMNLATNAGFAMKPQGGELNLRLRSLEIEADAVFDQLSLAAGRYLELSVSDTGSGIEPQNLTRIFEPFFTTKDEGSGTGLGLSIVHNIVHHLGGLVSVRSTLGEGSTFVVLLPWQGEGPIELAKPRTSPRGGQERILYVDDEPGLARLGQTLSRFGYSVTALTSPIEALALLHANPAAFDLLVTDQGMPELSGVELAVQVRRLRPGMPVILCTGYNSSEVSDYHDRPELSRVLIKPVTSRELDIAIREVVSARVRDLAGSGTGQSAH